MHLTPGQYSGCDHLGPAVVNYKFPWQVCQGKEEAAAALSIPDFVHSQ